jgi:predicted transcriptional regulator
MKILHNAESLDCHHAVQCIFNLNELDIKVYKELRMRGDIRADELAKILNKERSTVYRSLQKLTKCGICIKKTKTLEKGGYYHHYTCSKDGIIRKSAEKCLEDWYLLMKKILAELNE